MPDVPPAPPPDSSLHGAASVVWALAQLAKENPAYATLTFLAWVLTLALRSRFSGWVNRQLDGLGVPATLKKWVVGTIASPVALPLMVIAGVVFDSYRRALGQNAIPFVELSPEEVLGIAASILIFVVVIPLAVQRWRTRRMPLVEGASTDSVPIAPPAAMPDNEPFGQGWLEARLLEYPDFARDKTEVRANIAYCERFLHDGGVFTQDAVLRFLGDEWCRATIWKMLREELNNPARGFGAYAYCKWGPRLHRAVPDERAVVIAHLRAKIRGHLDPETGQEMSREKQIAKGLVEDYAPPPPATGDDLKAIRALTQAVTASPTSPLPHPEKYANAVAYLDRLYKEAATGDARAIEEFCVMFENAHTLARDMWGSTGTYYDEFFYRYRPKLEQLVRGTREDHAESLLRLLDRMTASIESPLPPEEALKNALVALDNLFIRAESGDKLALPRLPAVFEGAQGLARLLYGKRPEFSEFFTPAADRLRALTAAPPISGSAAERRPRLVVDWVLEDTRRPIQRDREPARFRVVIVRIRVDDVATTLFAELRLTDAARHRVTPLVVRGRWETAGSETPVPGMKFSPGETRDLHIAAFGPAWPSREPFRWFAIDYRRDEYPLRVEEHVLHGEVAVALILRGEGIESGTEEYIGTLRFGRLGVPEISTLSRATSSGPLADDFEKQGARRAEPVDERASVDDVAKPSEPEQYRQGPDDSPVLEAHLNLGPGREVSITVRNRGGAAKVWARSVVRKAGYLSDPWIGREYRLQWAENSRGELTIPRDGQGTLIVARNTGPHADGRAVVEWGGGLIYLPGTDEGSEISDKHVRILGWFPDDREYRPSAELAIEIESDPPSAPLISIRVRVRAADHTDIAMERI